MVNKQALEILNKSFGYESFRAPQDKIISDLIDGKNISVVMPTGGGKSMCYQIPSLVREGVGIVVSPLIALMEDQVNSLKGNGIKAAYINSTLSPEEKVVIKKEIENNEIDLLYVSPELLLSPNFYNWIKKLKIALFAIDEAHCVSQWGHDFRPEYIKLSCLVIDFPNVPRIALTATANELTRKEILSNLSIDKENQFLAGFDRSNISYNIQTKSADEKGQLVDYINKNHKGESGIVYCSSRKRTEEIAKYLRNFGYDASHYHAGVPQKDKTDRLNKFLNEDNVIIVATIAFGMGIDKPNVRFVCHIDIPSSIEAYYQETGRAGRDGNPSVAWMSYGVQDVLFRQRLVDESGADEEHQRIEQNALNAMLSLCEASHCRRQVLIGYFGDELKEPCGNCDTCINPPEQMDATEATQKILSAIVRTKQKHRLGYLIDLLRGEKNPKIKNNKHHELSVFGVGTEFSKSEWRTITRQLIVLGYIQIDPIYNALWLTEKGLIVLRGQQDVKLSKQIMIKNKIHRGFSKEDIKSSFSYEEASLFNKFRDLRMQFSKKYKIAPYLVFNDETLIDLVIKKPSNERQMILIEGIGYQKNERFGKDFLKIIQETV